MTTLKYNELDAWIQRQPEAVPRFILIGGDPYLVRTCLNTVTRWLRRIEEGSPAMETLDGRTTPVGEIIEQISTFSFFSGAKVLVVKQSPLFATTTAPGEVSYSDRDQERLIDLVKGGIPDRHRLVITSPILDRRRKSFKALNTDGLIIDCAVPSGSRKADLDEQQRILHAIADRVLSGSGPPPEKTIGPAAFSLLFELTGFNPERFAGNLEKLIAYTGDRPDITPADIHAVILRERQDPVFNLTNALMDRNIGQALFYLSSLLSDGFHPLQVVKSMENMTRRLLLARAFAENRGPNQPGDPGPSLNFNTFKQQVMPAIVQHDTQLKKQADDQQGLLFADQARTKKKPPNFDLVIAPNPNSPYPVFQTYTKAGRFSLEELSAALAALSGLDLALKTSSMSVIEGIEQFMIIFCQKGGWSHAEKNQNRGHRFQP